MSRIYIKTLGGIQIGRDGKIIHNLPNQPIRCALFLYLAIKRKATRDELITLIWPDRNDEKTRHSLSQTLYELRKQLGDAFFHSTNEYLSISVNVEVDILDFNKFAGAGQNKKAFDLYDGIFLQGYHLNVSKDFESWIERQRFELERRYRDICRELSKELLEKEDNKAALEIARKWVDTNPLEDEAQHLFIELLAKTGQRAEAIQQYDKYEKLISEELNIEPLDETKSLIQNIRHEKSDQSPPEIVNESIRNKIFQQQDQLSVKNSDKVLHTAQTKPEKKPIFRLMVFAGLIVITAISLFYFKGQPSDSTTIDQFVTLNEPDGIAVLPFVNMSADPEQEYFADGITEDLLTSLTKLQRMRVISRTSIMRYKNSNLSLPEIAVELNVAYILEGSVRRDQDRVRITAQLIEVENDNHLWAETYDQELTDIFQVKSDIAHQISEALQEYIPSTYQDLIASGNTDNITAYDLLLRGRDYLNRPGAADHRKYTVAYDFFRQAIEADPEYTRAYSSISELFRRNVLVPIPDRRDSMLYYSGKAVELDREHPEALTELGFAHLFNWEHSLAETNFLRALSIDPNQADAMSGLARLSALNGRLDEAVRWERVGLNSDPLSAERLYNLGQYLFDLGDIRNAQENFLKIVTLVPEHPEASYMLALTYLLSDEKQRADSRMHTLMETASDPTTANVMMAMYEAQIGNYENAEHYILQSSISEFGAARLFYAFVARKLGKHELMIELLDQPKQMFSEWRESGFTIPPRGKFYVSLIHDDLETAVSIFEEKWRSGLHWLEDPPEIGIYWIDRHPITKPLQEHPRFIELITELQDTFDQKREEIQYEIPKF